MPRKSGPGGDKPKIVFKRIVVNEGGGHSGGAWKIAYADFVTAMMAFFLLMWLLGSVGKHKLEGISEYFKQPLSVALTSTAGGQNSVLQGGGKDPTRSVGQTSRGEPKDPSMRIAKNSNPPPRDEVKMFEQMAKQLEEAIESNRDLKTFRKQLRIDITTEGLRIQIVDEQNRPMFNLGSAELQPHTKRLLFEIAKVLGGGSNLISLTGHTDSHVYLSGNAGYSNWELSSDRANASRRELVYGGVDANKILRVVGMADSTHLNQDDPNSPQNRRISIVLMTDLASEKVRSLGSRLITSERS